MFAKNKYRIGTFVIAVLAVVALTGCYTNTYGGGTIALLSVQTGLGTGEPTEVEIGVSANCSDARDMFRSTLHITDSRNGANFTALLPWTPVSDLLEGNGTTCEDAADQAAARHFSVTAGMINSHGQENGLVNLLVTEPGTYPTCGELQTVYLEAIEDTPDVLPGGYYSALGCLDHGKIVIQTMMSQLAHILKL